MTTSNPHADCLLNLSMTWSALAHGLLAVEALLATRGPRPVEPADDAPQPDVESWLDAEAAWQAAGDSLLASAGVRPGVIAHQRTGVEAEIREVLLCRPEYDDGADDWGAEIRTTLASALDADPDWIARAWAAYRA